MTLVYLVETSPWDATTGATVDVYLAGGGSRAYDHKGRADWFGGVVDLPAFAAGIGFDQNGWTGGALPQTGGLQFMATDTGRLNALAALNWLGAPVKVSSGDDASPAPAWTVELLGTVAAVKISGGKIIFTVTDLSGDLSKPVLYQRFAGTGGIEGDVEVKDRIKRRTWGRAFNVEGKVLLKASNIYEFGDPARPLYGASAIKDMGRATPSVIVIDWQGSIAATLAALIASTPVAGGCAWAASIACVKWWTQPHGPLTADLIGELGTGYVDTAPAIAERMVSARSTILCANVAANVAIRPGIAGIHVDSESETVGSALDRLLFGVSLGWVLAGSGNLYMMPLAFDPAGAPLVVSEEVSRESVFKPVSARRLGFSFNYRLHSDGEISAAVLADDVTGLGDLAIMDRVSFGSPTLTESDGVTVATDSRYQTQLGTALGIAGQSDWATYSGINTGNMAGRVQYLSTGGLLDSLTRVTDRRLTNLFRLDGTTVVTEPAVVTSLGTALGFLGQGSLATLSSLAYGGGFLTGFGALAALAFTTFGSNVRRADGSTLVTDALAITSLGTASAIAGQGPGATASGDQVLNNSLVNNVLRISRPVGGTNTVRDAVVTGAIRITLPQGWSDTMMRFTVEIFDYATAETVTYIIAGYTYSNPGGAAAWTNCSAQMVGADAQRRAVRFGYDGTKACVWIGEPGSTWSYPQIQVVDFQAGFSNYAESQWATGWAVAFDTVAALNVTATIANPNAGEGVFGVNLLEASAGTLATLASFRTNLGNALGFAGQGSLATLNSLAYGGSYLTGFGGLAALAFTTLGANVRRADGSTILTDALAVTSLGTASGIAGQGSFATVSSITTGNSGTLIGAAALTYTLLSTTAVRLGVNVTRNDGTTALTDALAVTTLGTAAGIAGQGALATLSGLAAGGPYLSGFGDLSTRGGIRLGTATSYWAGLIDENNSFAVTNALAITSLGTATGIAGQGAFATLNAITTGNSATLINAGAVSYTLLASTAVRLGTNIVRTDGSTSVTEALVVTTLGTASAISGQGPGATATADQVLNNALANSVLRIARPAGGSFYQAGVAVTGAIKIRLPQLFNSTMMRFRVDFFDYASGETVTYFLAGYNFATGAAWVNVSAQMIGPSAQRRAVRFGHDGTKACIWIGETTSTWDYPTVQVVDFQAAFSGATEANWATGWTVSLDTVAATNVSATVATPHAGEGVFGVNLLESAAGTSATLANFRTSLGNSLGFTGQGSLATLNSLAYGGAYLTGFGTLAAQAYVTLSSTVRLADGTTVATNALLVTSLGVATGIAGQGALATQSTVNFSTQVTGPGVPEAGADVTLTAQFATTITTALTVAADYTGAIAAGLLPKYNAIRVTRGGVDVTTSNSMSYVVQNATGGCIGNVTIDNTNGSSTKGRQAIGTGFNASGTYEVVASYSGVAIGPPTVVTVTKTLGVAPGGSGSGSSGYTKSGSINPTGQGSGSTTFGELGRISNMAKATGETIRAYFNATYILSATSNASRNMQAKWQYSVAGANSWTDFASAVSGSNAQYLLGSGESTQGSITCNQTATPADGNYDVRLVVAISSAANSANLYIDDASASVAIAV